jgi:membrane protease YdiL (CAAX protease family)
MSLFNDKLKKITLKELLSLIIILFVIQYLINALNIVHIDSFWIYIFIIFYFIFKLRAEIFSIKDDMLEAFSPDILKTVLAVVILNIFFSYGMLYLSNSILDFVPSVNLFNSFLTGSLIATIFISPISEELIFRGVFLNRLQLAVPVVFAVLISSLLFAALHSFGSIFSAFIFGVCIAILYLKTDNIFVPIFAHFLNNLFAEIIVVMDPNKILFTNISVVLVMSILAIVSFVIILIFIIGNLKNLNNNDL